MLQRRCSSGKLEAKKLEVEEGVTRSQAGDTSHVLEGSCSEAGIPLMIQLP